SPWWVPSIERPWPSSSSWASCSSARAGSSASGRTGCDRGLMLDVAAYLTFFLVVALFYGLVCLGLNLQWGFTGLFNAGVSGFVAVGAYGPGLLTAPPAPDRAGGLGLPVALGWVGAALLAGLAALIVGAVTLRLRRDYLAISTFGIAVTIQLVALKAQRLPA